MPNNATPRAYLEGIVDQSGATDPVFEDEQLPQHLPLIYLLCERGPTIPHIGIGDVLMDTYGKKTFDLRTPWATHQTVLANRITSNANSIMVQRIELPGAKKAILRVSIETIPAEVPLYERNSDGTYQQNADGSLIQEMNGQNPAFVIGQRVIYWDNMTPYTVNGIYPAFGEATVLQNYRPGTTTVGGEQLSTLLDAQGQPVKSTVTPLFDLEVTGSGDYGQRIGMRLSAPNSKSASAGDAATMNTIMAYLYRFVFVERPENMTTPNAIKTNDGVMAVDMTFKDDVHHPRTDVSLSADRSLLNSYQRLFDPTRPVKYGPFGRFHIYKENLTNVLNLLVNGGVVVGPATTIGEKSYDSTAAQYGRVSNIQFTNKPQNLPLFNLFTGTDQYGVPYWTVDVSKSIKFGGTSFGDNTNHYAMGGTDNFVLDAYGQPDRLANLRLFDDAVQNQLNNFGDLEAALLDMAKYPLSTVWDSGFSYNTKLAMDAVMARRKDFWSCKSPQSIADYVNPQAPYDPVTNPWIKLPQNTSLNETSLASQIQANSRLYPENEIAGTGATRSLLIGQSGYLVDDSWPDFLPLTIDFAGKVSAMMGAATGVWKASAAFDKHPNNMINDFYNVNMPWKPDTVYDNNWDAGLNWAQYYDTHRLFYPAFQTIYDDETSTLNSFMLMVACCYLQKVNFRVWTKLVGNTDLIDAELIRKGDELIADAVDGKFNNRFKIVPKTQITSADAKRGYSWTTDIEIGGNVMKTAATMRIIARRLSDMTVTVG